MTITFYQIAKDTANFENFSGGKKMEMSETQSVLIRKVYFI